MLFWFIHVICAKCLYNKWKSESESSRLIKIKIEPHRQVSTGSTLLEYPQVICYQIQWRNSPVLMCSGPALKYKYNFTLTFSTYHLHKSMKLGDTFSGPQGMVSGLPVPLLVLLLCMPHVQNIAGPRYAGHPATRWWHNQVKFLIPR